MIYKFNLPISEELLGAYLEGNLSGDELLNVQRVINSNEYLSNLMDESLHDNIDWNVSITDDYASGILNFELPLVPDQIEIDISQLISIESHWDEMNMDAECANVAEVSSEFYDLTDYHENSDDPIPDNENPEGLNGQNIDPADFDSTGDLPLDMDSF